MTIPADIRLVLAVLLLAFAWNTHLSGQTAQGGFKGKVIDCEDRSPLGDVICQELDTARRLMAYALSDADGSFSLEKKTTSGVIAFRLLGYGEKVINIRDAGGMDGGWVIELEKADYALKEIVVSAPPVTQSNDTLRYNAGSFIGQEDRYVADLLKKLPGIKVNDNGTISYQGEAINKFYIEGRDLLGGQYNLATNNMPVDAVAQVEVLENHQPVKALKDVRFSEKAALNLKLKKKYKVKPFGEVQAGAGASPALYDGKAFLACLSANMQTIANFKINNTGTYILGEMDDKLEMNNLFSYEALPDNFVSPLSPQILW